MGLSYWIHVFWLAGLALQTFLVAVLALRKMWKKFPVFFAYLVASLIGNVAEYAASKSLGAYLVAYIIGESVSIALALAVIYEVFRQLFSAHAGLRKVAWLAFRVVCVLLVLLGAMVLYTHGPLGAKGIVAAVIVVEQASRIVEVGLIMFLFLFASAFGLRWRQQIFGVVLGFGVFGAIRLAGTTLVPHSFVAAGVVNLGVMASWGATILIWIGYTLAPERVTGTIDLPKTAQLERWNQAIMELIHQ